jgi:Lysozyme like domain/Contractile injection system tube protein
MAVYLSGPDVAAAAYSAGFRGDALIIAVAVSHAESTFQRDAISPTQDYGLWQINKAAHGSQYDFNRLLSDANYNAQAAFTISGGGTKWSPWSTYNNGAYAKYMNQAQDAVNYFLAPTGQPVFDSSSGQPQLINAKPASALIPATGGPLNLTPQMAHDDAYYRSGTANGKVSYGAVQRFPGQIQAIEPQDVAGLTLNFLYNPSEIDVVYSADTSRMPQNQQDPSQVGIGMATTTTISFDLFFDRLLQMIDVQTIDGVMVDVARLEQICGMTIQAPFFVLNRVFIMFGDPVDLQFTASINQFSVRYTHFTPRMVPVRAVVSIQATRLAPSSWDDRDPYADFISQYKAPKDQAPAEQNVVTAPTPAPAPAPAPVAAPAFGPALPTTADYLTSAAATSAPFPFLNLTKQPS